jgi:ankyrin repeat domain-containing protein 50
MRHRVQYSLVKKDGTDKTIDKYRKSVMEWLSPTDQSEIHEAALRRHEPGTGQWFLGSDTFQNWREDPGTSLWLYGEGMKL